MYNDTHVLCVTHASWDENTHNIYNGLLLHETAVEAKTVEAIAVEPNAAADSSSSGMYVHTYYCDKGDISGSLLRAAGMFHSPSTTQHVVLNVCDQTPMRMSAPETSRKYFVLKILFFQRARGVYGGTFSRGSPEAKIPGSYNFPATRLSPFTWCARTQQTHEEDPRRR